MAASFFCYKIRLLDQQYIGSDLIVSNAWAGLPVQWVSALLVSFPHIALISVLIEWFVNVNGFITALTPVREREVVLMFYK